MTSLSHKCRGLRDLVPSPFLTSSTLPLLILLISKMKGFFSLNVSFLCYNTYYLYIPVSQNIEGQRKRERERVNVKKSVKLALVFGAYDLNLSTTLTKLDTVVL